MRTRALTLLLSVALPVLAGSSDARGWELTGHSIVGAIADAELEKFPKTKAIVLGILGQAPGAKLPVSLAAAARFADCARGEFKCGPLTDDERSYASRNPGHSGFHFVDIPIQRTEYVQGTSGTSPHDAVMVIGQIVSFLRSGAANTPPGQPANLTRAQAIWLLAHLVGDLHQPLHVGGVYFDSACRGVVDPPLKGAPSKAFPHTRGGNTLFIGADLPPEPGKAMQLHRFWDEIAVNEALAARGFNDNPPVQKVAAVLVAEGKAPPPTRGDASTWAQEWVKEALPLARTALTTVTLGTRRTVGGRNADECNVAVTLPRTPTDYRVEAARVAAQQLTKAGHRLAAMLVAIFDGR